MTNIWTEIERHHMNIECVLFDLDGVLVDACDWHYQALNVALVDAGYPMIDIESHISTYNGLPTKVKLQMLGVPDELADHINKQKQKHTLDIIRNSATIMQEKIELHEYLKSNGIKIACVTNSIEETAREMLVMTGQISYIDSLVTNEMVGRNKPYPDCYNYAISTLGVNPLECLCVEDSPKGIEAAAASLAKHLWVVTNTTNVDKKNYINFVESKNADSNTNGRRGKQIYQGRLHLSQAID
jgi:beta-phosphoglucomutase